MTSFNPQRALVFLAALVAAAVLPAMGTAGGSDHGTLFAAPDGSGTDCSQSKPCTLATAVSTAADGTVIQAGAGTYPGNVVVTKSVTLLGHDAVIDGSSTPNTPGLQILASDTRVQGFTIQNATLEGILVGSTPVDAHGDPLTSGSPIDGVTIQNNVVMHNDAGFSGQEGVGFGECFTTPFAPGDCGEGIHLVSATDSVVRNNLVSNNAGGILLTDEFGPAAQNDIANNTTNDNTHDCGITLASHTAAGVFENKVENNVADDNGVEGEGGGFLLAAAGPMGGAWSNTIRNNEASGNGLAGVVIHQHFAGANLNDNVIEGNTLSNNNLDGDHDFAAAQDDQTTGVFIAAGLPPGLPAPLPPTPGPITGTVVRNNIITDVAIGIWTLNAPASQNTYENNKFGPGVTPLSAH
jgi:parallel beta-helix repeat protein